MAMISSTMWDTITTIGAVVVFVFLVVAFVLASRKESRRAPGLDTMTRLYAQKHPYSYEPMPPGKEKERTSPFGIWEVYNGITLCKIHGYRIFHCDYEYGYLAQINIFQLETSNKFAVHTEFMTREKVVTCETYEDAKKEIRRFLVDDVTDRYARALIPELKKAGMYDGGVEELS